VLLKTYGKRRWEEGAGPSRLVCYESRIGGIHTRDAPNWVVGPDKSRGSPERTVLVTRGERERGWAKHGTDRCRPPQAPRPKRRSEGRQRVAGRDYCRWGGIVAPSPVAGRGTVGRGTGHQLSSGSGAIVAVASAGRDISHYVDGPAWRVLGRVGSESMGWMEG
jgi:hypothetical protein